MSRLNVRPLPIGYHDQTLGVSSDGAWGAIRTEAGRARVVELDPYGPVTCALDAQELRSLADYCQQLADKLERKGT